MEEALEPSRIIIWSWGTEYSTLEGMARGNRSGEGAVIQLIIDGLAYCLIFTLSSRYPEVIFREDKSHGMF